MTRPVEDAMRCACGCDARIDAAQARVAEVERELAAAERVAEERRGRAKRAELARDAALARVAFLERALTYIAGMCDGKAGFGVIADEARAALASPPPHDKTLERVMAQVRSAQDFDLSRKDRLAAPPPHDGEGA